MKTPPTPRDPLEAIGEAYELLLEKSLDKAHKIESKGSSTLHNLIDHSKSDVSKIIELSKEEMDKVATYLKRDLHDAAEYMRQGGEDIKNWFGFDVSLIKERLRDMFLSAADQTTVELLELKHKAANANYQKNQFTGPGTLHCDSCDEKVHFHQPGHIPACPKCEGDKFHRKILKN